MRRQLAHLLRCLARTVLGSADHNFGGFDQGESGVAGFEGELAYGVGGDDGGDALIADGQDDLGQQAFNDNFKYGAGELVASADAGGAGVCGCGGQELAEGVGGDAVVTAGSFDGADASGEDPVLEGGVADAELFGGLARGEQGGGHGL